MKAYGVFDGGGVKGAALAGCLAAAQDRGIEFVGFGGTSAGAIVATLAAVGYSGREIYELMRHELHPRTFLDDDGILLRQGLGHLKEALEIYNSNRWLVTKLRQFRKLVTKADEVKKRLMHELGLYAGERLRQQLLLLIKRKLPYLQDTNDVTFAQLKDYNCSPLKIVASNVTHRRLVTFSCKQGQNRSVLDAVRMSTSYPFLFTPVCMQDGAKMTDGGLSSNLPAFLFAEEHLLEQYPTVAFDLWSASGTRVSGAPAVDFIASLMDTALEASDDLMTNVIPGIQRVAIPVPEGISTLKFDLTAGEIECLYNAGRAATGEFLDKWEMLQNANKAGSEVQRQLQVQYGDSKLFELPLRALILMVEHVMVRRGKDPGHLRSSIMLPTGRVNRSRIAVYYHGYRKGDPDRTLELDEFGGCTGKVCQERSPAFADLDDAKTRYADWGMTEEQQAQVSNDRKAMVSVPIFSRPVRMNERVEDVPVRGVLSIDSATPLTNTGWVLEKTTTVGSDTDTTLVIDREFAQIMKSWADVVAKLLR